MRAINAIAISIIIMATVLVYSAKLVTWCLLGLWYGFTDMINWVLCQEHCSFHKVHHIIGLTSDPDWSSWLKFLQFICHTYPVQNALQTIWPWTIQQICWVVHTSPLQNTLQSTQVWTTNCKKCDFFPTITLDEQIFSSEDDAVSSASSLLRNNSQPSNEVLLRRYLFITPIVTEYPFHMTIPIPRTAFVTILSISVTITLLKTWIVTEYPISVTMKLT